MYLIDIFKSSCYGCNYDNGYQVIIKDNIEISILPENVQWLHPLWPPLNERDNPMNLMLFSYWENYELLEDDTEVFKNRDVIIKVPKSCRIYKD
jgi:hypothetical protein